jgi:hypothetical protein
MKTIRFRSIFLIIVCITLSAGCGKKAAEEFDLGTVENSVYRNKYFGFAITLPSNWNIQDEESRRQIMNAGAKALAGGDKNPDLSQLQTANLLTAFKHPINSQVPINSSITCVAERVIQEPSIAKGRDYLLHSRKVLEASRVDVSFAKEMSTEILGGRGFDVMYLKMSVGGKSIEQAYYATIIKGYALVFVISFATEEDKATLNGALNSLTWM